jgi:hypothetical protein
MPFGEKRKKEKKKNDLRDHATDAQLRKFSSSFKSLHQIVKVPRILFDESWL